MGRVMGTRVSEARARVCRVIRPRSWGRGGGRVWPLG